jgi:hypothetical protein
VWGSIIEDIFFFFFISNANSLIKRKRAQS